MLHTLKADLKSEKSKTETFQQYYISYISAIQDMLIYSSRPNLSLSAYKPNKLESMLNEICKEVMNIDKF